MRVAGTDRRGPLQKAEPPQVPKVGPYFAAPSLGLIRPQSVKVVDGYVRYDWEFDPKQRHPAPPTLLFEFLGLADASDSVGAIQAFVERYGGLGLCPKHNRPFFHQRALTLGALAEEMRLGPMVCDPSSTVRCNERFTRYSHEESIRAWRSWVTRFRRLRDQADALKTSKAVTVRLDRWFFRGDTLAPRDREETKEKALLWAEVTEILNAWLYDARVTPWLTPTSGGDFDVSLGSTDQFPLFGELTLQLFSFVAGTRTVERCDGCDTFFSPHHKRAARRHKFCEQCGVKASWRVSKRDKRAAEQRLVEERAGRKRNAAR